MRWGSIILVALVLLFPSTHCAACGSGPHPEVWDTLPPTCPKNDVGEAIALSLTPVLLAGLAWAVKVSQRG
jgi:hypothetical protein